MVELDEMINTLKKLLFNQMESIISNSHRRNNNDIINLTTSNDRSVYKYKDLTVGVVHYNMESFGEN